MPDLFAYTDGACSGNPGPGGWGVLLIAREDGAVLKERELMGGEALTTNNRMELMAAISALESLSRASRITVVTDSAYVKNGVTGWIHGWKRNGWKTADKKPVKNVELWQRLDEAQARPGMAPFKAGGA
jgi:ribonuclease HI